MKKLVFLSIALAAQMSASAQTKLQVIHNCADLAADSVDVYLGVTKLLDNFAFRTATSFIDAPSGTPITLGIAPKTSTSLADTFYSITVTLDATKKYIAVANGIESPTGYSPAASTVPLRLSVYDMARETATTSGNTDILVVHGSTDAPTVDVKNGTSTLVNDISFGEFCSTGYVSVPEADYTLDVTTSDGATIVKRYSVPLASLNLGDSAITVVASGFLDPTVNSNGAAFGLWVALPEGGNLIELTSLTVPTSVSQFQSNTNISVYPNPTSSIINVKSDEKLIKVSLSDISGRVLTEQFNSKNVSIDISEFSNGLYLMTVERAAGSKNTYRIIKK